MAMQRNRGILCRESRTCPEIDEPCADLQVVCPSESRTQWTGRNRINPGIAGNYNLNPEP